MQPTEIEQLIKIRKEIHANPELSGAEYETARRVLNHLDGCKTIQLADTGVAAIFEGNRKGPTVLFRSELDALPIQEVNNFDHKSKTAEVSHKCGHDGHTTILLGVANELKKNPPETGTVVLLFQPAEETGKGASDVLLDEKFSMIQPDYVFAMHNLPGFPLKTVIVKPRAFTAAVKTLIFNFEGKSSHAAEPENGLNPSYIIAELLLKLREIENPDVSSSKFCLLTPVCVRVGELAYGTSPGNGELHITVRSWETGLLNEVCKSVIDWATVLSLKSGIKMNVETDQEFYANINDPEAAGIVEQAALENEFVIGTPPFPFRWGEDFGLFTDRFKGAMFGIGSGENCPALHNPDYDFPDEIIPVGVKVFCKIAKKILR